MCVRVRVALAGRTAHRSSGRGGIEKPRGSGSARGRAKGLEAWRRTKRGIQVVEEESVVFSNIEVRVKRAGPSGLGDLEVTKCIARIRAQLAVRERGRRICSPDNDRSKIHA